VREDSDPGVPPEEEDKEIGKLKPERFRFGKYPTSKLLNDPNKKKKVKTITKTVVDPVTGVEKKVTTTTTKVVKTKTTKVKKPVTSDSSEDEPEPVKDIKKEIKTHVKDIKKKQNQRKKPD